MAYATRKPNDILYYTKRRQGGEPLSVFSLLAGCHSMRREAGGLRTWGARIARGSASGASHRGPSGPGCGEVTKLTAPEDLRSPAFGTPLRLGSPAPPRRYLRSGFTSVGKGRAPRGGSRPTGSSATQRAPAPAPLPERSRAAVLRHLPPPPRPPAQPLGWALFPETGAC